MNNKEMILNLGHNVIVTPQICSFIYVVLVYSVFTVKGIDLVKSFISFDDAKDYLIKWANKNNTENLVFDDITIALNWFKENESGLNETIDFHETKVGA